MDQRFQQDTKGTIKRALNKASTAERKQDLENSSKVGGQELRRQGDLQILAAYVTTRCQIMDEIQG